jgi:hypothetical protein
MELRNRNLLLVGISLLLAIHALLMSRFIPSSLFLVISYCWLWVGVAALIDRLKAARTMASTMIVILLAITLIEKTYSFVRGDVMAFYFLAMIPSLTAWICVYVYVRYLERAGDVGEGAIYTWFAGRESEQLDRVKKSNELGRQFTEEITRDLLQDNSKPPDWGALRKHKKMQVAS